MGMQSNVMETALITLLTYNQTSKRRHSSAFMQKKDLVTIFDLENAATGRGSKAQ